MTGKYDDIIDLPRLISQKHPHMSIAGRAGQFAPYKTITVYHDQISDHESQGHAVFQENQIIPDKDYFEYEDDYRLPDFPESFSDPDIDNFPFADL